MEGKTSCHLADIQIYTKKGKKSCLLGIHHGANSNGQRLFGYFGQVIVEEPSIGDDCILRQSLQTGSKFCEKQGKVGQTTPLRTGDNHLWVSEPRIYLDTREEPGSLKAMCPSGPIPLKSNNRILV